MEFLVQNIDLVLKIGALVLAAYGVVLSLRGQIKGLAIDIGYIKENQKALQEGFNQLNTILTRVAVQDTRLNMIEKKLDELAHGKGIIN